MPINKNQIRRMCAIFSIVKNSKYPVSKLELLERVNDLTTSEIKMSSLEKDMFSLQLNFDVELLYLHQYNGYVLKDTSEYLFIRSLFEYLRIEELKIVELCLTLLKKAESLQK